MPENESQPEVSPEAKAFIGALKKPGLSAAAAAHANPDRDTTLVRIFNRSGRSFTHEFAEERHHAPANTFASVPRWVADLWLKGYPNDIMANEEAQKHLDAAAVRERDLQAKLAEQEAKIKELEGKQVPEDRAAALEARIKELEALLAPAPAADAPQATAPEKRKK